MTPGTGDPLARFRAAAPVRKPMVFAVGRKIDIKAWEADARLTEDVTPITRFADTADLRFIAEDVLVYVAGWERLVDAPAVVDAIEAAAAASHWPRTVR
jgi:hypothetical protein